MKKDNLKHRLKSRFVVISAIALIILQTIIVSVSIYTTYRQMTVKADRMIKQVTISDNKDMRYFKVYYQGTDNSYTFETSRYVLIDKATAINYAQDIIADHSTRGYADDFRYLVHKTDDITIITFLSQNVALDAFHNQAKNLIFISIISILITIFILYLISSIVIKPIILAENKQKEFITSASHELKTPLTVIQADAEMLETEIGHNEWISDILKETKHMRELTHRLVYLARLEETNQKIIKIEFPISDVAEDLVKSFISLAKSQNKQYQFNIQKNLSYLGEEKSIRELFTILLDNAFKYCDKDGRICVSLSKEKNSILFCVENSISNINQKELTHFTERFYRKDSSSNINGYGIGLSMAKAITEAHNGNLKIELNSKHSLLISAILK